MQAQFKFETHEREGNHESEQLLYNNRAHFNNKCLIVFKVLMLGEVLDVDRAHREFGVRSFPTRIFDLREMRIGDQAIEITDETIPGSRCKRWYMTQEQIEKNKIFIPKERP